MADDKKASVPFVMLPVGRFSFPKIDELTYSDDDTEKKHGKYNFNLIIPAGEDLGPLKKLIQQAAVAKFKERAKAMFEAGKLKMPTKKGSEMINDAGELYDGYLPDSQVVSVNFYNPMEFLDQFKNHIVSDSAQAEKTFYPGCHVQVAVTAHGYDQGGGRGVNLRCWALMKRKDDEMFGGSGVGDADDVFADVEAAEVTAEDMGATEAQAPESDEWGA